MKYSELYKIGKKYEDCGDIGNAYRYYLEAALAENDGKAISVLADMYLEGEYVHEDSDKAGHYYGIAYDQGLWVIPWRLILAGSYWEKRSNDNEENLILAMKYYQAAADQGERFGNECLGQVYYKLGEYDKAYENLKNIKWRNPCGLYYLGRLYDEGRGVERNLDMAIELYKRVVKIGMEVVERYGEDDHCMMAKQRLNELGISWQSVS